MRVMRRTVTTGAKFLRAVPKLARARHTDRVFRSAALALTLVLVLLPAGPLAQGAPFAIGELAVRGRVLEVFAVRDDQGRAWLAALSTEAMPPDEKRFLTLFARGEGQGVAIALAASVVAVDVADVSATPGPEVLLLEAERLALLDARGAPAREIALEPPLPLPPRTREQSRLEIVGAWSSPSAKEALLPDVAGLRLVSLGSDETSRRLALPITAVYGDPQPGPPIRGGFFRALLSWPTLFPVDDDGDRVRDLVATTRYGLTAYRGGASGLSAKPSRARRFPPFEFNDERRADSNVLLPDFADLDGDGDADLIVHRTTGTLASSRSETRVHANFGGGADPLASPQGSLIEEGGLATAELDDLDGDGRAELVQSVLPFGIAQLARILLRGQAELDLRVYAFEGGKIGTPRLRWSDELTLPFDFKTARVTSLLPKLDGDFNGDGRRDLLYGDAEGNALVRLGEAGGAFGRIVATIPLKALGGATASADLDGDRLHELIYWDPVSQEGRIRIARNRGRLPGSPSRLESAK
jgi:hypothetical protein